MYTELNNIKHAERVLNSMAQDENVRVWIKNQDGTTIRIQPGCKVMVVIPIHIKEGDQNEVN